MDSLRAQAISKRRAALGFSLPILFICAWIVAFQAPCPLARWSAYARKDFFTCLSGEAAAAPLLALVGVALVLLCGSMAAFSLSAPRTPAICLVLGGWLGASASAVLTLPGWSSDLGDYTFSAHAFIHMGANPMTTPPSALIGRDEFPHLGWYTVPSPYGPLWQWIAAGLHIVAGEDLLSNFIAFKALGAVVMLISGRQIYGIVNRVAPARAPASLALWLWNPTVLVEGVMHAHNDLVAVPLILGAIGLLAHTASGAIDASNGRVWRGAISLVLLAAAGLIKATFWLFWPVVALWLCRHWNLRRLAGSMAIGLAGSFALLHLALAPFGGWEAVANLARERGWWPSNSWAAAVFFALRDGEGWAHEAVAAVVSASTLGLFGLAAGLLVSSIKELRLLAWGVALAYLLVGTQWFQPWYAIPVIALATLTARPGIAAHTLVLSLCMFLHHIVAQFYGAFATFSPGGYDALMSAVTLLAPQVGAAYLALRAFSQSRQFQPRVGLQ